jgi:hypothetical protein
MRRLTVAVVVAALGPLGLGLSGCTSGSPPGPAASAVPTPKAIVRWSDCVLPGASATTVVRAVSAGRAGEPWAAVGQQGSTTGTRPAFWTSEDGCTWRQSPVRWVTPDGAHTAFQSVVRLGGTLVALGGAVGQTHGNVRPTLWRGTAGTGPSGGMLREVQLPRELFGGPRGLAVTALAAGRGAALAVGGYATAAGRSAVQVWRTIDGQDWQRLGQPADVVSTRREQLQAAAVAAAPTGGAVLVGTALELHDGLRDGFDGAVWYSPDTQTWRRVDVGSAGLTGPGDQRVLDVAWQGSRYLAVASVGGGDGGRLQTLTSPDGQAWTATGSLPTSGAVPAMDLSIALGELPGSGALLAGATAGGRGQLWRSTDGAHWDPEALPPGVTGVMQGMAVASGPTGTVLVVQTAAGPHLYRGS